MPSIDDLLNQRKQFLRFLQHRVESVATAEDILQSAYLRAMQQASSMHSDESAAAWFYRILRNAVIDHYRHRAAQDRLLEGWANELLSQPDSTPEPGTEQLVCECLGEAVQHLRPAYSEILQAVDLAQSSLDSFAESSGITSGNATVRLHRARQALRKSLIAICGACSRHGCMNCTCRSKSSTCSSSTPAKG
jgi:RNA polymerase sigma-70 factor (ECF subfamily)